MVSEGRSPNLWLDRMRKIRLILPAIAFRVGCEVSGKEGY